MMSKNNERKIIDSLANDKTLEMKSDDLVQMLNDELSKPENEVDVQLMKEILDVLEPTNPNPAQVRASWSQIKENLPKRPGKKRWRTQFARFAAAAAVISIVLVSTIEDAGAFRWTLIQKILKPVAETFGIMIDEQPSVIPEDQETTLYSVSDAPSEFVTYAILDEVPERHNGYLIRPKWIPDGFVFSSGSHFTSIDSEIFSLDFVREQAFLNLHIHINTLDSSAYSREFERNLDIPIEMTIGQKQVTFYNNTDDKEQAVFWIAENAHYLLVGEISFDDVILFIESME